MDPLLIIGIAALAVVGVALIFALRPRAPDPALNRIEAVLGTLASQNADAQSRQQEQERAFTAALDKRFGDAQARLTESLGKSATDTNKTITDLRERLVKIDEAQKKLAELSTHVVNLQDILSNKQARGAFGQDQMELIVRDQLPPELFEFQSKLSNNRIVDCLIRLPPPLGPLAIDAKFPREAWDALRAADSDKAAQEQAMRAFSVSIMTHVKDIAERYLIPGETAEHALMFVPSEAVYGEIYARIPDVADRARRARVFIVSPNTFWAILNTMRAVMRDSRMREQAGEIQKMVGHLLNDVKLLDERTSKLQRHFDQAVEDVRLVRTSAERIANRGDRIREVEIENGAAGTTAALAPPKV